MTDSVKPPFIIPRAVVNVVVILAVAYAVQRMNSNSDDVAPTATPKSTVDPTSATVKLRVAGVASKEGAINAALFFSDKGFPSNESADYTQSINAANVDAGTITMEIAAEHFAADTPFAIAVYHDANNDGVMNKSFVGVPTEAYGFTNNARSTFGPPSFDAAAMPTLDPNQSSHAIDVELR